MDIFTRHTLDELMPGAIGTSVSIYLPASRQKETAPENRIRLKNLAAKAERLLLAEGETAVNSRKLVARIHALEADEAFWRDAGEGLAVFASQDFLRAFRLPCTFRESVFVGADFQITPLLPLLTGDGEFLVLAISKNRVRLLEGTRIDVQPIALATLPRNLAEALNLEQPQAMMQCHGGVSHGKAGRETVFHGQGGASDHAKTDVLEYFQQIDHALCDYLGARHTPLVFAGVDYLFPLYCRANHYGYLELEHISGNPELLSDHELHDRACNILAPRFAQPAEDALERVLQLSGTDRCTADLDEVLRATYQGTVDILLVARGVQQWGRFDATTGHVEHLTEHKSHSTELVNLAVVQTLAHRGKVFEVDSARLPGQAYLVAALRYTQSAAKPATSIHS